MLTTNEEVIAIAEDTVMQALDRILRSARFVNSVRLSKFLRYTVDQTLQGHAESVKEYTVGINAYGRRSDFDPSQDTIVRTEARRLRLKLKEYYEREGEHDDILISFELGSYVPIFRHKARRKESTGRSKLPATTIGRDSDGMRVAVTPFVTPFKAYIAQVQFDTDYYYNAYPRSATNDVKAALRVQDAVNDFAKTSQSLSPNQFEKAYLEFLVRVQADLGSTGVAPAGT
jgi:hypothetical protein